MVSDGTIIALLYGAHIDFWSSRQRIQDFEQGLQIYQDTDRPEQMITSFVLKKAQVDTAHTSDFMQFEMYL